MFTVLARLCVDGTVRQANQRDLLKPSSIIVGATLWRSLGRPFRIVLPGQWYSHRPDLSTASDAVREIAVSRSLVTSGYNRLHG